MFYILRSPRAIDICQTLAEVCRGEKVWGKFFQILLDTVRQVAKIEVVGAL
jgi:hypothetical protein